MYFSDRAVIVVNPEVSSCRDSDKMLGLIGRYVAHPTLVISDH